MLSNSCSKGVNFIELLYNSLNNFKPFYCFSDTACFTPLCVDIHRHINSMVLPMFHSGNLLRMLPIELTKARASMSTWTRTNVFVNLAQLTIHLLVHILNSFYHSNWGDFTKHNIFYLWFDSNIFSSLQKGINVLASCTPEFDI